MDDRINLLIDELPTTISVNGKEYEISSDFRTFVLFEMLLNDNDISDEEKLVEIINLIFVDDPPEEITDSVFDSIIEFYRCGNPELKRKSAKRRKSPKKIYDFEYDDAYIYAAFLSAYSIDLNDTPYLHWWKFRALFESLPSDCEIVKIMGYRSIDISTIKDNSERARIQRLQAVYALPNTLTVEEKAAKAGALFGGRKL